MRIKISVSERSRETKYLCWGFKSKKQGPLFMIWWEWRYKEEVTFAETIFVLKGYKDDN